MANMNVKVGKKWGRALKKGNPLDSETIPRSSIEVLKNVTLRGEPDLVDGIMQLIESTGAKTVPEVIRHLLRVSISAVPMDAEVRAAINSVKSQMTQYLGKMFWAKMAEMMTEFHTTWSPKITLEAIEQEMARIKAERGEAPRNEQ